MPPAFLFARGLASALQVLEFVGLTVPLFGIWQRVFLFSDVGPLAGQLCVDFNKGFLACRQLVFREDGLGRQAHFRGQAPDR